jgi:CheY-like chemotaxis protein
MLYSQSYTGDVPSPNVKSEEMRGGLDVIHKSRGVRGASSLDSHARMIHTSGEEYEEKMKMRMNIMRDSYSDSAHSLLMISARSQALQESIHISYSPSCNPSNTSVDGEQCTGLTVADPEFLLSPVYDILIVDDSALNRKMMKRYFTLSGHTCYEAADGKHAVSMVKERLNKTCGKRTFDAVLMDFVMPIMDGPTACRAIRALGYKGLIFGVTGNYRERDVEFFVNRGADVVLSKPFDTDKFQQCMRSMFVPNPDFATTLKGLMNESELRTVNKNDDDS